MFRRRGSLARRSRGYILIEALMTGAILAVAVGAVLGQMADARKKTYLAERKQIAQQLVLERFEEARGIGYTATVAGAFTSPETIGLGAASYKRTTTISAALTDSSIPSSRPIQYKTVTVTVCAPANLCPGPNPNIVINSTEIFRLYRGVN